MEEGLEVGWKWSDLLNKDCSCPSSGCVGLKEGFGKQGFERRMRRREGR